MFEKLKETMKVESERIRIEDERRKIEEESRKAALGVVWEVLKTGRQVPGVKQPVPPPEIVRAKVPGGWLICAGYVLALGGVAYSGMTFYPDPDHLWDGNALP
jgi:hypothetical protein